MTLRIANLKCYAFLKEKKMKSVHIRIHEYEGQASSAEKGIIRYLNESSKEATHENIYELAKKTFTSTSTIIRFCKKIGFKGFKDFQKSLIHEMALVDSSKDEKFKEISKEDTLEEIIEKVTQKNILALENTKKLLEKDTLEACVNLLIKAKTVCLFGMGSSFLVARDFNLKLLRINKPCVINEDWHAQMLQAKNMTKEDVGIAISYSGMTEEVIKCISVLKEKGIPIIAITRFEPNTVSGMADYNLNIAATEFIFRSGAMSSRISQMNIIDILYTAMVNKDYDKSLNRFSITHINKPMETKDKKGDINGRFEKTDDGEQK